MVVFVFYLRWRGGSKSSGERFTVDGYDAPSTRLAEGYPSATMVESNAGGVYSPYSIATPSTTAPTGAARDGDRSVHVNQGGGPSAVSQSDKQEAPPPYMSVEL